MDTFRGEQALQTTLDTLHRLFPENPSFSATTGRCTVPAGIRTPRIGQYELLECIGRGGMGEVYKARHVKLDKLVALKLLPAGRLDDEHSRDRFDREMKAVGRLDHPNIVQASDAGESDGLPFLVMKYIDGVDLAKLAERHGALPIPEACALVRQAALGLQHVFAHGLVHRDIKPSNIMLSRAGEVLILDLGLALLQHERATSGTGSFDSPPLENCAGLTADGHFVGTLEYMAPEQQGNSRQVDVRADLYGLGATLYRLLSGRPPQAVRMHAARDRRKPRLIPGSIPSIGTYRNDVPEALCQILERMLAADPDDRFDTPMQVADALAPFAAETDLVGLASRIGAADETRLAGPTEVHRDAGLFAASTTQLTVQHSLNVPPIAQLPGLPCPGPEHRGDASSRRATSLPFERRTVRLLIAGLGIGLAAFAINFVNGTGEQVSSPRIGKHVTQEDAPHRDEARGTRTDLAQLPTFPQSLHAPFSAAEARAAQVRWADALGCDAFATNSIGMPLALIPPGEFILGSPESEIAEFLERARERNLDSEHTVFIADAGPQHRVRITQPFYLGVHEVTQAQFRAVVGKNPSQFRQHRSQAAKVAGVDADELPVEHLTWNEAVEFCLLLSHRPDEQAAGRVYRLPTNAEWEFACRAGIETTYWHGSDESALDDYAWWLGNSDGRPHAVGQKPPNPFGLYDITGNVWEFCSDWYDPDYYDRCAEADVTCDPQGTDRGGVDRILRGGSWRHDAAYCRSASRLDLRPDYRNISVGFRVVCSAPTLAFPPKKP